ncbi:MAG: DHA3 family macrolide efflux protein-like MFS transporter [Candidatus Latescibacterota bacterium]
MYRTLYRLVGARHRPSLCRALSYQSELGQRQNELLYDYHLLPELEKPSQSKPALRILTNGPYLWFFASNLLASVGSEMRLMAQSWLILELGGTQSWVGAATGLRVLPAIVLALLAGVLIDRIGSRKILVWDRVILAILAVTTTFLVVIGPIAVWHIVFLSTLAGAMIGLAGTASQTLVTQIVAADNLQAANSLHTFQFSIARALGPLIGAALIASFGLGAPWVALVVLYSASIACLVRLPDLHIDHEQRQGAWQNLVEGFSYVKSDPLISRVMLLAFSVVAGMTVFPVMPIYARDRFGVGETGFATMMSVFAAGQAMSAIAVTWRGGWQRKARPILCTATLWGVAMATFGFTKNYYVALAAMALMGASIPPWITSVMTILQTRTEKAMLGRVMAVFSISFQVATLGWLLGGWVGEAIGNESMLLLMAIAYLIMHYGVFATSKELRKI